MKCREPVKRVRKRKGISDDVRQGSDIPVLSLASGGQYKV